MLWEPVTLYRLLKEIFTKRDLCQEIIFEICHILEKFPRYEDGLFVFLFELLLELLVSDSFDPEAETSENNNCGDVQ